MARAPYHNGCTGPYQLRYFKVAYIRQTAPAKWIPIGFYCEGCKAFQPKL